VPSACDLSLWLVRFRSWLHLHDGAASRQCSVLLSLQSPRCSYLGAITHCARSSHETQRNPEGNHCFSHAWAAQYRDNLHAVFTCQRPLRASPARGPVEVRRGKDSDFENPVNALDRLDGKNPFKCIVPGMRGLSLRIISRVSPRILRLLFSCWACRPFIHSVFVFNKTQGRRSALVNLQLRDGWRRRALRNHLP